MSYANKDIIQSKALSLIKELSKHLKSIEKEEALFFNTGKTVYIPDIHGDFVHLIITLYRHGVLDLNLNLNKDCKYVFLGDFYDRAPDTYIIDFWLNNQIKNKTEIYRLLGNHEMAFFERKENGHPIIFPSQDAIKDIAIGFQITENLLQNIATGSLIAAYVDTRRDVACNVPTTLYVHSYIINDDFIELGLNPNTNIINFATTLNKRLQEHGQNAYETFLEGKRNNHFNWKLIMEPFLQDPLFNIYDAKNDIHTSFLWRRTGLPRLNIYPCELDVDIPDNVHQIVGHTPTFLFKLSSNEFINKPFVIPAPNGTGKVQFSDVGIGYYYKNDSFERPDVLLKDLQQEPL